MSRCRRIRLGLGAPQVLSLVVECWAAGEPPCHLWVHHGYIALVPEGERVAIALRRCDIKQVRWTTMTLRMKMSPDSITIARLRFQVQGGDWLSRQFMTSGSTIQLFDAIAEADLPLAIQ